MRTRNLLILLALVAMAATPALALCSPPKSFTTYNTVENPGAYYYIRFGDTSDDAANLVGEFWQTDNKAGANNGGYPVGEWLVPSYYYPGTDSWYLNGNLGDSRTVGCPAGSLTVEAFNTVTGGWVIMTIDETPARSVKFDFSRLGTDFATTNLRPRATSSSGAAVKTTVVSVPDPSPSVYGGAGDAVTEIQVYQAFAPNGTTPDPNITAGGWALQGTLPATGGSLSVQTDCTGTTDSGFIATALVTDGNAPTAVSSNPTEVACDPNLADPTKFKLIDRDSLGKGKKGRR